MQVHTAICWKHMTKVSFHHTDVQTKKKHQPCALIQSQTGLSCRKTNPEESLFQLKEPWKQQVAWTGSAGFYGAHGSYGTSPSFVWQKQWIPYMIRAGQNSAEKLHWRNEAAAVYKKKSSRSKKCYSENFFFLQQVKKKKKSASAKSQVQSLEQFALQNISL